MKPINHARISSYECECGYLMVREGNESLRCSNEQCQHYGTAFRMPVWPLIEIEA
jgi:hypothetical protein